MTASGIQYGSGFRFGAVYEIDQVTGRLMVDSENAMARRWPSAPASDGWRLGTGEVF